MQETSVITPAAPAHEGLEQRISDAITSFCGKMLFVYVHIAAFTVWIATRGFGQDSFPFNFLTMAVSLEAIFLSTFVLITQNRMAAAADKRADLDVQMTLLIEHELTRLMAIVSAVAQKLGVTTSVDSEVEELKQDVTAEAVLDKLESAESLNAAPLTPSPGRDVSG